MRSMAEMTGTESGVASIIPAQCSTTRAARKAGNSAAMLAMVLWLRATSAAGSSMRARSNGDTASRPQRRGIFRSSKKALPKRTFICCHWFFRAGRKVKNSLKLSRVTIAV
ncbi:hypothetical protein D3C85_1364680 [compost metagenome]